MAYAVVGQQGQGEDRVVLHAPNEGGCVVVVADGAGGLSGGATAAETWLALVAQALREPGFAYLEPGAWCQRLVEADQALTRTASGGETTAVVVAWTPRGLAGASVGDSEAWLVGDDGFDDLTAGQSRKRLGSGRAQPVGFTRSAAQGTLVVGTDGLFRYAPSAVIAQLAREGSVQEAVDRLVAMVRLPSGRLQDDVAVVVVRW